MTIRFAIPGRTENTSNLREHWAPKAKRAKAERDKAMKLCPKWEGPPLLAVTLFRFGTHELDDDGLRSALKAIRDGVASRLRVDDGSKLVAWLYQQATCPYGEERVEVIIEKTGSMANLTPELVRMFKGIKPPDTIGTPTPAVYRQPK